MKSSVVRPYVPVPVVSTPPYEDAAEAPVAEAPAAEPKAVFAEPPYAFEKSWVKKELSIVRNVIVKGHGGKVDFLTTPGQGTTFRISLPIKHVVEPTTAALPAPTPAPAASS